MPTSPCSRPTAPSTPPVPHLPGFLLVVWFALLLGSGPLIGRLAHDHENRQIQIAVDLAEVEEAARISDIPPQEVLSWLTAAGVSACITTTYTLSELEDFGHVKLESVTPVPKRGVATRITLADRRDPFRVREGLSRILSVRSREEENQTPVSLEIDADRDFLDKLAWFGNQDLEAFASALGLIPLTRITTPQDSPDSVFDAELERVPPGGWVVPGGTTAPGFPDRLTRAATALRARNCLILDVEFAGQEGVKELAGRGELDLVGLHTISSREMAKYDLERVLPRWERAINERHNRVLLVRFFPEDNLPYPGLERLEANRKYIETVAIRVKRAGFTIGTPLRMSGSPVSRIPAWSQRLALLGLLILLAALGSLLLELLGLGPWRVMWGPCLILVTPLVGLVVAKPLLGRAVLALGIAVLGPVTGTGACWLRMRGLTGPLSARISLILREVSLAFLLFLSSGLAVGIALTTPEYVQKLAQFRGVKIVYVLPVLLMIFIMVRHLRIDPWNFPLTTRHLIVGGILLGLGLIYVLRSGNFPLITGPKQLEFQARDTLEEILPVRPRVKEFLIGYPCLLLAGACPALAFGSLEVPLVLMGTAAGVSAVNSFCHIHSPVALSVFRGLMGLMAGVPIGLGLILLLALIHPPAPGRYVYIWGYLGFDNLGDDLILHAVLRVLDRELPPDVHLVVGTRNPRTFRPPDELGFLTARGRRIVGIRRMNPFAVARALAYAAASLSLGGGLFQDRTSRQSMVYYMLHLAMGQLRGIRHTWVLSQSIPEIRSGFFRDWLVDQLRRTDLTILRDPASAERLRLWSGSELNPVLSTDLTLWERPELPPPILESGLIGINLRPLPGTHEKADRDTIQDLTDSLVPFIKAQGLRVRYLIAEPDSDELPMRKLQECLDPEIFEVATISAHDPSAALSGLSGLIAMRYHVQVLAVLGGYPFFGISYAEKTAAWLEDLGHDSWIHVEGLDPQGFQVALRTWWTGRRKTYDSDHGDLEALEPRTRAGQAAFLAALRAFRCETSAGMRSPGE